MDFLLPLRKFFLRVNFCLVSFAIVDRTQIITGTNRKTGVKLVALVNRF